MLYIESGLASKSQAATPWERRRLQKWNTTVQQRQKIHSIKEKDTGCFTSKSQRSTDPKAKIAEAIFCTSMTSAWESISRTIKRETPQPRWIFASEVKGVGGFISVASSSQIGRNCANCLQLWPHSNQRWDKKNFIFTSTLFFFFKKAKPKKKCTFQHNLKFRRRRGIRAAETSWIFHAGVT